MSSIKRFSVAAAAALSLLLVTTAAPNLAVAAKNDQAKASDRSDRKASKSRHVTKKTVVHKTVVRNHVRTAPRHRDRIVVRTTAVTVPLVVLGSPVVYRSYGPGWCRALHRGHHWAPGLGWHAGKHVGRVHC